MNIDHTFHVISIAAIPVLLAITLHEVAHGWAALRLGDHTAERAGRLSLNPLRHVDPIGTVLVPVVLLLIGSTFLFGWAKPVPVNFQALRNPRTDMAWVAAAGPAANLVMAIAWTLVYGLVSAAWVPHGVATAWVTEMAVVGLFGNVLLAVFNLLPIPPLDGGRVLVGLLPLGPARALARVEPFGMWIVLGLLYLNVLGAVLGPIVNVLAGLIARIAA